LTTSTANDYALQDEDERSILSEPTQTTKRERYVIPAVLMYGFEVLNVPLPDTVQDARSLSLHMSEPFDTWSSDFASESLCKVTVHTKTLCILLLAAPVIVRTNVRTGN